MATIKELQKQSTSAPKFVLFTNEFGCDMYISDPAIYDGIVTDTISEALQFSVGFDDEDLKVKTYSAMYGYSLKVVFVN